ncbi:MAG: M28 family peptidase [bacterium]
MTHKLTIAATLLTLGLSLPACAQSDAPLTPGREKALEHISATRLETHLSFLASDMLKGRDTPSEGLEAAALYIASQFERAGLEPAAEGSWFQTADMYRFTDERGRQRIVSGERLPDGIEGEPVRLRNVAGLLRGSDPELRDTFILVSAHYDHVGIGRADASGDSIYNGANDNGSGTVTVVELALAMGPSPPPGRSILFITWFGEERGLLGSRWYAERPLVPLERTVANVNLEQVGRTDGDEGDQTGRLAFTGHTFSEVPAYFQEAGETVGIDIYHHEEYSAPFFRMSDNIALAGKGVPAHSATVAFQYEDYHRPGDHWQKIDYRNMARTARTLALGLYLMADNPDPPGWNESLPETRPYVDAWKALHGGR